MWEREREERGVHTRDFIGKREVGEREGRERWEREREERGVHTRDFIGRPRDRGLDKGEIGPR